ncbi:hypothetical protein FOZ61_009462 [Perkinsus olseni]|uniref:Uncharacterized protein n=1 Tax=Perkinsus olseni TaxID=32597 RepID=A0A7J6KZS3_PEROL|nr:hypothetical protein FOL46_009563 [Perkinsus olseni]KAF4652717.1 hypothetical protein FOZ61_009462 [Perkinsus olseni]
MPTDELRQEFPLAPSCAIALIMADPCEHGGEPAATDSVISYTPLLVLLNLRDDDDLNYVNEDDVKNALPVGSTLQQRVDYVRLLRNKHAAARPQRGRASTSYSSSSVAYSVLASAVLDADDTDGKALAGVLKLAPPRVCPLGK